MSGARWKAARPALIPAMIPCAAASSYPVVPDAVGQWSNSSYLLCENHDGELAVDLTSEEEALGKAVSRLLDEKDRSSTLTRFVSRVAAHTDRTHVSEVYPLGMEYKAYVATPSHQHDHTPRHTPV